MSRAPTRGSIRLPPLRKWTLYAVMFGLWASGGAWLALHYFLRRQGDFGPESDPLEPWSLKAHGALAFVGLVLFGVIWAAHVLNGWTAKRRRWTGGAMVALALALILTGYLLYYAGDEGLRSKVSIIHWGIGLGGPLIFFAHRYIKQLGGDAKTAKPQRKNAAC